jgi:hypothetical protein
MKNKKSVKKKKLKKDDSIYVQIDYGDAVNSKKNLLSYQIELINMIKSMKKYSLLRENEKLLKSSLQNLLKATNENIKKMEGKLPKVEELKQPQKEPDKKEPVMEYYEPDLDSQLNQIKKKLEAIGR